MGFKKSAAVAELPAAEGTAPAAVRNEPATIALEDFEMLLQNSMDSNADLTMDLLPESIQAALTKVFGLLGIEHDGSAIYKYIAEKQRLQGPALFAHGGGCCILFGDYVHVLADTSAIDTLFDLNSDDKGHTLYIDPKGVQLPINVLSDAIHAKSTKFKATMMQASTFGDISEYLYRGEQLRKWKDEPAETTYTIHDITPVMDRDKKDEVKYAILLVETADGTPARVYAPGNYVDYAGLEFPAEAVRKGSSFTIGDRTLEITGGFAALKELEIGTEYKVIGFEGGINKFNNWQATLSIVDASGTTTKVNGNHVINQRLQGQPEGSITPEAPATLVVLSIEPYDGGKKTKVVAQLKLASDGQNALLAKIQAKMNKAALATATADGGAQNPL